MPKSVQFQTEATIHFTYSSLEYDRSLSLSSSQSIPSHSTVYASPLPQRSTINITKICRSNQSRPFIKPLDLSLVPNSSRRALDSNLSGLNARPVLSEGHHDQAQQEHDGLDDFSMVVMAF
ncbi:hypothetical protein V8B55DRAFT_1537727 [Mucor lusitanicus]|uniref:Uncharacterized protein n=1 Tax=Mucor circinelloides f. lusitanicus TaxID=29924 RepID=A0A8H4BBX1_MUCCL|nr:hypothetical protein FB192DRAFT_1386330 [Mucor lusitanicus]